MADARKFLYDSDYPMPYLVYFQPCSYTVGGTEYYKTVSFAHELPFTPLLLGQWSTVSGGGFSVSYDLAIEVPRFSGGQPLVAKVAGADSTNIYLDMTNNTGSDLTFYYRLAAFAPPEFNGAVEAVNDATPYQFNSDFNYLKIYKAGSEIVAVGNTANAMHDLGYIPQTRTWREEQIYVNGSNRTIICPMNTSVTPSGFLGVKVSDLNLTLGNTAGGSTQGDVKFYYHIYADEN